MSATLDKMLYDSTLEIGDTVSVGQAYTMNGMESDGWTNVFCTVVGFEAGNYVRLVRYCGWTPDAYDYDVAIHRRRLTKV